MVITSAPLKPLVLFYLIQKNRIGKALVFTKSTESTVRLLHLFEYFSQATNGSMEVDDDRTAKPIKAEAFSSDLSPAQRTAVLERFKRQELDVCVSFVAMLPSGR